MSIIVCTADRLFDGTATAALSRPVLRIDGGRIASVGQDGGPPEGPAVRQYDFPGCTILPGLIDTHVHLVFCAADSNEAVVEQVGRESDEELLARALANARAALRAGVTTVRDCGGKGRIVQQLRDRIRTG